MEELNIKKAIIIISLILLSINIIYALDQTKEVTSVGYGIIINNDINKARKEAIDNAKAEALEKVCGIFVKQRVTAENFEITKNKIETFTNGYIKNFCILEENQIDEDNYHVSIQAEVVIRDIGKITDDGHFYIKDGILTLYTGADSEITIPDTVTSIGYEAFKNCDSIEKITFSNNLKYIEDRAFIGCINLRDFNLPDGLISIGEYSFSECKKITNIDLPKSLTTLGEYAFSKCINLNKIKLSDKLEIINSYCFKETGLSSINIPKNIKVIGHYAFENCHNIKEIILSEGLKFIGTGAFFCDEESPNENLHELIIPSSVEVISNRAFSNNTNLKNLIINSGVKEIGDCAFGGEKVNYSLKYVKIPETVNTIGKGAFLNCAGINTLIIKNGVSLIDDWAFCCEAKNPNDFLNEINIPGTVKTIGKNAFANCHSIKKLIINEGVEEIGDLAFGCDENILNSDLKELVIPGTVIKIGDSAFTNNVNLEKLTLKKGIKYIGRWAFGCEIDNYYLKELLIPSTITYLGDFAFNNYKKLKFLKIKNGQEPLELEMYSFAGCDFVETLIIENGSKCNIKEETFMSWAKTLQNFLVGDTYIIKDGELKLGE